MTKRTENVLEQIQTFQDDEKFEIVSTILQKNLSDKMQMIYLDENILFVLNTKQLLKNQNENQRNLLEKSLIDIQKYETFKEIIDPVLWQKQIRDDR